jgi:hypothetical protein
MEVQIQKAQVYSVPNWGRVRVDTQVLKHLAGGRQSEAREVLEVQLDFALIQLVRYEQTYCPAARDGIELGVVREAREYRAEHPWTNARPDVVDRVQKAFKWAD